MIADRESSFPFAAWALELRPVVMPKCANTPWVNPEQSAPFVRLVPPYTYGLPRTALHKPRSRFWSQILRLPSCQVLPPERTGLLWMGRRSWSGWNYSEQNCPVRNCSGTDSSGTAPRLSSDRLHCSGKSCSALQTDSVSDSDFSMCLQAVHWS